MGGKMKLTYKEEKMLEELKKIVWLIDYAGVKRLNRNEIINFEGIRHDAIKLIKEVEESK